MAYYQVHYWNSKMESYDCFLSIDDMLNYIAELPRNIGKLTVRYIME